MRSPIDHEREPRQRARIEERDARGPPRPVGDVWMPETQIRAVLRWRSQIRVDARRLRGIPGHADDRVDVRGQLRGCDLLGLGWPAKRLAKQHLDRADPGSNVGDLYLDSVFLAAVWAREGRPVLPRRSERRIEQRALDLADGLGRDLRESRANLRRGDRGVDRRHRLRGGRLVDDEQHLLASHAAPAGSSRSARRRRRVRQQPARVGGSKSRSARRRARRTRGRRADERHSAEQASRPKCRAREAGMLVGARRRRRSRSDGLAGRGSGRRQARLAGADHDDVEALGRTFSRSSAQHSIGRHDRQDSASSRCGGSALLRVSSPSRPRGRASAAIRATWAGTSSTRRAVSLRREAAPRG